MVKPSSTASAFQVELYQNSCSLAIHYSYNPPCRRATSYPEIDQRLQSIQSASYPPHFFPMLGIKHHWKHFADSRIAKRLCRCSTTHCSEMDQWTKGRASLYVGVQKMCRSGVQLKSFCGGLRLICESKSIYQ
jgi:hypothetical protein